MKDKKITNPIKAIREKCLDCCCESVVEVKECPIENCPLYPFRFGKNPFRKKKEYSEEELNILKERLGKGRETRKKNLLRE